MAKMVVLLALVAFVSTAYALQCQTCVTDKTTDNSCEMGKNMKTVECGKAASPMKGACLKRTWKDKQTGLVNVTRKCVVIDKSGNDDHECKNVPNNFESVFCETCTEDLCNTATNANVNFFTVFGTVIAFLSTRYLLLN